ncbi:hypothetical protein [Maricaulis parjimensis]|uniref:hypothetical protein n=1 Tax=Maricaulis parjimensis TaxID=144023 RepID=UPI001939DD2E|nr:hypothetical protein [Maricaulis parjimensis]
MQINVEFETHEARRLWADFLKRLDWSNRHLPSADRSEARDEAIAHMAELLAASPIEDETDKLRDALQRFGPLPAPPPVWRKPLAVALHYLAIMTIGASGLVLLILLHMTVMEAFNPGEVGLYVYPGDGLPTLSYETQSGAREILGAGFIPVMLAIIAAGSAALFGLWRLALAPEGPVSRWMKP